MTSHEQKFRELWEAVDGNCWHEWVEKPAMICGVLRQCIHCKEVAENHQPFLTNPTLTLDVLFEIARKLQIDIKLNTYLTEDVPIVVTVYNVEGERLGTSLYQETPQLALLDALYQAMKDK